MSHRGSAPRLESKHIDHRLSKAARNRRWAEEHFDCDTDGCDTCAYLEMTDIGGRGLPDDGFDPMTHPSIVLERVCEAIELGTISKRAGRDLLASHTPT